MANPDLQDALRRIAELEDRIRKIPIRTATGGGGGGDGFEIKHYDTFPAIPATWKFIEVDGVVWIGGPGRSAWVNIDLFSTKSGTPA